MKHVKLFEDYSLAEGKITLSWNDDENSIVFSDGEIAQVDYDGEFKYRDEWFSTVDHTDAKDLSKTFKKDLKEIVLCGWWKVIKAVDPETKPQLEWKETFKDKII